MGGLKTDDERAQAVLRAAKVWEEAKESLATHKTVRKNAEVPCYKIFLLPGASDADPTVECRHPGLRAVNAGWCPPCARWQEAQLSVEKYQRHLKKAEKALTTAIKAWRRT